MIGGNSYKATTDTGATVNFVSEEMADILMLYEGLQGRDGKLGWQTEDAAEIMRSSKWR